MKKQKLTPEALTRLRAIEYYNEGHSQRETARKFGVHFTTIGEWLKMYAEGGEAALNVPMKPRPVHVLDINELRGMIGAVAEKYERRIAALLELATTGHLNETAAAHGVTPQGLAKWRREFLSGKWPVTIAE